ncbi:MAG TPA: PIN domain-containing protein [Chloroflexota bacterium]|jgi:predicted nucleic acid-binding protein|nr:PIN domain-containing protein [Chloroflexota bacterium]
MPRRDPRPQRVVLDANVLYAMPLADTLLTAAAQRLFQLRWSAELLQEVRETMLKHQFPAAAVDRRLHAMQQAFRNAEVTGYQHLIAQIQLPDPEDRQVVAAAIRAEAGVIVTANLQDFPGAVLAAHAIRVLSPDDFLTALASAFPQLMLALVQRQAAALRRPPMTFAGLVAILAAHAPRFGAVLRELATTQQEERGDTPEPPIQEPRRNRNAPRSGGNMPNGTEGETDTGQAEPC